VPEQLVDVPAEDFAGVAAGPEVDDGPAVGAQHDHLARLPTYADGRQIDRCLVDDVHRDVYHVARRQVRDVEPSVAGRSAARGHVQHVGLDWRHVHDVPLAARSDRHVHLERTVAGHVVHDHVAQAGVRHVHELARGRAVVDHDRLQEALRRGRARQVDRPHYLQPDEQGALLFKRNKCIRIIFRHSN